MVSDQRVMWNDKHATGEHESYRAHVNPFAKLVLSELKEGAKLLDLGCGIGKDDYYFASHRADVTATDFSDVIIADNQVQYKLPNLTFEVADISEPLKYSDSSFDVVYAHLSLHYFSDEKTREVFAEIARIIKPRGRLFFACKSVHDHRYGEGEKIGTDIFVRKGHIRHFFSVEYCKALLKNDYTIDRLEETSHEYNGDLSNFVYCFATKKP